MAMMFLLRLGEDEDIVEVDDDEDVRHIGEDVVHQTLERSRGVGKSEGHDEIFEASVAGLEGCLPLVTLGDPEEVVSAAEIDFGEDRRTGEAVE